ncbi:SDR family NAD(P)-dependent oxidoreductase, partial [Nocardia suismassiliense]
LPRTLHIDKPTTEVDWTTGSVALLTDNQPWPEHNRPRRAAISSFGISGTNAHIILEQVPAAADFASSRPDIVAVPWVLSGRDEAALRAQAARLAAQLADDAAVLDVGYALAARTTFEQRAAITSGDLGARRQALATLASGETPIDVRVGRGAEAALAVVFSGQGTQRPGMGRELYDTYPTYAEAFDNVCAELDRHLPHPLRDIIFGDDETLINQTQYAQPALFALQVALYRLWESWGITPTILTGHSIGEITAAHITDVLTLTDAATLITTRARLMQTLPHGGAMVAIDITEQDILPHLLAHQDKVGIAAINGPNSLVLSGDQQTLATVVEHLTDHRHTWLRVSHAFHSPLMDPILDQFRDVVAGLTFANPTIPLVSTVTGQLTNHQTLTNPEHWINHARNTVRFADAITTLTEHATGYLEIGPSGSLVPHLPAPAIPTLRLHQSETEAITAALGRLVVNGVNPRWSAYFAGTGAHQVPLPTYPFQRTRYWPEATTGSNRAAAHPLSSTTVELAHSTGILLTARLCTTAQPWLADHTVAGTVVFPGTAFIELVLRAAQTLGVSGFEELTLENPLMLPEHDATELQVAIAEPDSDGRRTITVHSRLDGSGDEWQPHATGVLGVEPAAAPDWTLDSWPPQDAVELPVAAVYAEFAAAGLDYGPFFQGLRAAWRAGEDVAVEVALPAGTDHHAEHFGLHPALLDSVLHGVGVGRMFGEDGQARLPFSWSGVTLHATGATTLRARLSPKGEDAVSLRVADATGRPAAEIERLTMRKFASKQPANTSRTLYVPAWVPVQTPSSATPFTMLGDEHASGRGTHVLFRAPVDNSPDPEAALTAATTVLRTIHDHTGDRTLVVLTSHAVAVDNPPAPAGAAVWGLVRTAQAELAGRPVLVDIDDDERSWHTLPYALSCDEPQLALRGGKIFVPRLVPAPGAATPAPDWSASTVLITGAAGALGTLIAQHLVHTHGARHLVLLSRTGDAPEPSDATVTQIACDLTDPSQLTDALTAIPRDRPLALVHCAGTLDDATIAKLTPDRLRNAFGAKATAAWLLHELTRDHDLSAFLLFSSAAATLGSPGQANYTAANAYLDALAHHRTSHGQPTTSIAWGLWHTGMAGRLNDADRRRLSSTGLLPIDAADGLALFDAAAVTGAPVVVPLPMNRAVLRRRAADGQLPSVLRDLVPRPARDTNETVPPQLSAETLRTLPPHEQRERLGALVRSRVAAVLGHSSGEAIPMDQPFTEFGFDSLMAVELRGALDAATGLGLPATVIFDHPTPAALHEHLHALLLAGKQQAPDAIFAEIDRLETELGRVEPRHTARMRQRLRSLLSTLEHTDTGNNEDNGVELADASLEEVFGIIDGELGLS